MDEARAVIARLDRIDALDRAGTPAHVLLEEVRALLAEAEAWVRVEPGATDLVEEALQRCRSALAGEGRVAGRTGRTLLA